ncbi:MAG: anti-sigma factor RsbA family regulatory protein [Kineosporiaceae bacterium]
MTASTVMADESIGTMGFRHETVFYREDEDFLGSLLPYVREGLERDEAVVVAAPPLRLGLLHDALADDAGAVELLDMTDLGANPARIIAAWQAVLDRTLGVGRGLRGIGEPAYPGRRPAELVECRLHELLLNRAFDPGPAWRLLCPYDEKRLPAEVCAAASAVHPLRLLPDGSVETAGNPGAEDALAAFGAPLPAPSRVVLSGTFADGDVPAVRHTVRSFARTCGVPEETAEALQLAASELATNSIRHGGGTGTVAMWTGPGAVVVEFTDGGRGLAEPLAGRLPPPVDHVSGRGLFLVNQLCDLVQLRASDSGTTVRVTTWL